MKKTFVWLAFEGGFIAAVWLGFIEGVEGAQHLATFFVWVVDLPLAFFMFTDSVQQKLAAQPPSPPIQTAVDRLVSWFALVVFVWHGHGFTAVAWGFRMLAALICRGGVEKLRSNAGGGDA